MAFLIIIEWKSTFSGSTSSQVSSKHSGNRCLILKSRSQGYPVGLLILLGRYINVLPSMSCFFLNFSRSFTLIHLFKNEANFFDIARLGTFNIGNLESTQRQCLDEKMLVDQLFFRLFDGRSIFQETSILRHLVDWGKLGERWRIYVWSSGE